MTLKNVVILGTIGVLVIVPGIVLTEEKLQIQIIPKELVLV